MFSFSLVVPNQQGRKSSEGGFVKITILLFMFESFFMTGSLSPRPASPRKGSSFARLQGGVDKVIGESTPRVDANYVRGLDSLLAIMEQIKSSV